MKVPYRVWRRLFWLPEPIYYKLLDWFDGNNGWRPLHMRHPEFFTKGDGK